MLGFYRRNGDGRDQSGEYDYEQGPLHQAPPWDFPTTALLFLAGLEAVFCTVFFLQLCFFFVVEVVPFVVGGGLDGVGVFGDGEFIGVGRRKVGVFEDAGFGFGEAETVEGFD